MDAAPLEFKLDFPIWSVVVGGIVIALLSAVLRGTRTTGTATMTKLFLIAVVGVATAKWIYAIRSTPISVETSSVAVPTVQHARPRLPSVTSTAALKAPESDQSNAELPEWTKSPVRIDGHRKTIVVSSGRFASEQEAELHGFQEAAVLAVKEYVSLDPRNIGAVQPQHADLIKESAVTQRYLEVTQHDFGKFQAPMYQLWLEVALTPELGERLAEPWRQAAVEVRLRTLAGWSVWGTAAAALAAFGLRLDSAWNGRRRMVIAGTTLVLALGSLAFVS